jgi:hypothetical protein
VTKYTNPNIAPEKVYFFYNKKEKIAYKLTGSEMRAFSELNDGTLLYERDGKMFNISLTIKQPVIKPIIWSICSSKSEFKKRKVKGTKCGKDEVKMGSITE